MSKRSPFKAGTGLLGATKSGQKITAKNVGFLPPGSVVRLNEGYRLIHLHDSLWLWCGNNAWCYDSIENLLRYLKDGAVLCHLPPNS